MFCVVFLKVFNKEKFKLNYLKIKFLSEYRIQQTHQRLKITEKRAENQPNWTPPRIPNESWKMENVEAEKGKQNGKLINLARRLCQFHHSTENFKGFRWENEYPWPATAQVSRGAEAATFCRQIGFCWVWLDFCSSSVGLRCVLLYILSSLTSRLL